MADGPVFPAFLKLEYQRDDTAKSTFLAELSSVLDDGKRKFKEFSDEAQTQLGEALSVKRNNFGSLDLGVDQLKAAAAAQSARATAAREIATATALAAKEEQDYSSKARLAVAASQALAIEEEKAAAAALAHAQAAEQVQERLNRQASATDLVVAASRRGTTESGNVINGIRAQRVAFTQLGQQLQDVVVQTQMGTNATTIFVQQVPQMAFALSGLAESTNKTYSTIGKFATFLSGGWGAAIFGATAILAPLAARIFDVGNAEEDAKGKTYDFSQGLNVLELSAGNAASAMAQLAQEMRNAIAVQGDFLRTKANVAQQSVGELKGLLTSEESEMAALEKRFNSLNPFSRLSPNEAYRLGALKENVGKLRDALKNAQDAADSADVALAQQSALERTDPRLAVTGKYNRSVGALTDRLKASQKDPVGAQVAGTFLSKEQYEAQFEALTRQRNAALDQLKEERKTGHRPKGLNVAERAFRSTEFGEDAAKKIENIRDSFADIPPEVEKANRASRELDDIITDLEHRKPKGFEALVESARDLKQTLPDQATAKAMSDIARDSERRIQLQDLLSQGRDAEAAALQEIWQQEQKLPPLDAQRRAEILAITKAEQDHIEALQKAKIIQDAYLDATRSVRSEVEAILGGYGKLSNLKGIFQQLQGRVLTENLFGDVFRDMDKWVKEKTGIGSSVDMMAKETERAGSAAGTMADTVLRAANRIDGIGSTSALSSVSPAAIADAWRTKSLQTPRLLASNNNEIVVSHAPLPSSANRTVNDMTPERYFETLSAKLTKPLIDALGEILGPSLAKTLGGPLTGALEGYLTTGTGFGAVLGGLKDLSGLPESLSSSLSNMFKGAQTGNMVAGIGNSLGIHLSGTGSQIGGAIGSFIPGGQVIGSIVGGLLGKIFSGTKGGYAIATNNNVTSGGDSKQSSASSSLADTLQQSVNKIAQAFGVSVGNYSVSIGTRSSGYIHVDDRNTTSVSEGGSWIKNAGSHALYNGKNADDAMRAAILGALQDGAIKGIHEGALHLLQAGKDLDAQLQKALDFENVFKELKAYEDPVGAALDTLDARFSKLKATFDEAGATAVDYAALEKLYGIERAKAVQDANNQIIGSLKDLMSQLTVNSSTRSLRDRESAAIAAYNPLEARVKAGDVTAYDDYAKAAQDLLAIERELKGSTKAYFDVEDHIKSITQGTINAATQVADAAANRDSPFTSTGTTATNDNASVTSAISNQTDVLSTQLAAANDNLASLLKQNSALSAAIAKALAATSYASRGNF